MHLHKCPPEGSLITLYMYAVSVVSRDANAVNNSLFNGLCDKDAMIRHIRSSTFSYDPSFANSVVLVNCNVSEHQGSGKQFQFNRSYSNGELSACLEELIRDLEQTLRY